MSHEWWHRLRWDIRGAFRLVYQQPAFSSAVILTIALAISINAALFGVIHQMFFGSPALVRDGDRLAFIYMRQQISPSHDVTMATVSYPDYQDLQGASRFFEGIAAFSSGTVSLGLGPDAEAVTATYATADLFRLLGVWPLLGRSFTTDEDAPPEGTRVAVLAYGLWQRRFAGDPAAIGQMINIDGSAYRIIGIAPKGFTGLDLDVTSIWLPLSTAGSSVAGEDWDYNRNVRWMRLIGRLRPGVHPGQAAAAATAVMQHAENIAAGNAAPRILLTPIAPAWGPNRALEGKVVLWLGAITILVLLIASANVANMYLVRALKRTREIGIRVALGVSHTQLASQLVAESVLLACLGGLAGTSLAVLGSATMYRLFLPGLPASAARLDTWSLRFIVLAVVFVGLLTGLVPVLQAWRVDVTSMLRPSGPGAPIRGRSLRHSLVVVQTALTVVLLVGTGLFVQSLRQIFALDLGFHPDHVLIASVKVANIGYRRADIDAFYERALERLQATPGVEEASLGMTAPFYSGVAVYWHVPGRNSTPRSSSDLAYLNAVTPDFFSTLGMRLIQGRWFTSADRSGTEFTVVVGDAMAQRLWPDENPIGRCIQIGSDTAPCRRIIGIVQDPHRDQLDEAPTMQYFVPFAQGARFSDMRMLFVRTSGRPAALVKSVRSQLQHVASDLPYPDVRPLRELIDRQVRPWRLGAQALGLVGLLALLMAAVGLYSLMAHVVTERRREFGIRMALGAQPIRVLHGVVAQAIRLSGLGATAGLVIAYVISPTIQPLLFDVSAVDLTIYAAAVLVAIVTSVLASAVPSWSAMHADPVEALRAE